MVRVDHGVAKLAINQLGWAAERCLPIDADTLAHRRGEVFQRHDDCAPAAMAMGD